MGKSTLEPAMIERIDAVVWGEKVILPELEAADPSLLTREPLMRSRNGEGVFPKNTGMVKVVQIYNDHYSC